MINRLNLENILFLDIETVPEAEHYSDLDDVKQELWATKSQYQRKDEYSPEEFYDRAGIWAEFGKIICISVGFFNSAEGRRSFRVKSFYGSEIDILNDFKTLIIDHFSAPQHILCAHNGKEFDFPYIARRMIIHEISLPNKLSLFGKKPWEVPHLDTLELWKFGDYKNYTSLKLLTNVLGIPSPKEDIDGSDIYEVFYKDGDLERIKEYCERDTIAVAQVILKLRREPLLTEKEIVHL
ncbi:MAG: 3'-5' exonuclease [Bacteroidia bacterium]|nr:3'-5' exonuclease [Bacteroidia bacterium]MBT8268004.1 3'-5' exonuclease [Bacteroidia bacterium]NNF83414.1 3'-5' exonuclease [Flavobacteriaceae bacterium]NNK71333.1 3'-5' exonuclease [Flavobacteriaceae bacterium]NNL79106.1 3'-5' exonuclease [Flavobacteriaceae bacterium]